MKIAVMHGSPKVADSISLQYIRYVRKRFPQHELSIHHITQRSKRLEADEDAFQEVIADVQSADGVLWASPVYYWLVPAPYKRFIELIWERGAEAAFAKKYAAALTTSIHFFDHNAHNYLQAICDDLNMRFVGSYSAYVSDLLVAEERERLLLFASEFFDAVEGQAPTAKRFPPLPWTTLEYTPGASEGTIDAGNHRTVIITDDQDGDSNLTRMVERFRSAFSHEVPVINLHNVDIKGGCQGCFNCGYDNRCAYADTDGFVDFYEQYVKAPDILVWAGTLKDRYLSSRWKLFFDRSFYNCHSPTIAGKQVALLISGPLGQNPNLQQILQAYIELQPANLAGCVTDEWGDPTEVDRLLDDLARRVIHYASLGYMQPPTFLNVAGRKLFRDEVWGPLRSAFQADHRLYKRMGWYDFPQKQLGVRVQNAVVGPLLKIPSFRQGFPKEVVRRIVQPHKEVVAQD